MFSLSRKSVLAMEAVVDIAHHGRSQPVPSRDFSERLGISRRHLEPVLQALVREGILKSIRGPRGGYVLAREKRRISLGDIVRAANSVADGGMSDVSQLCSRVINPVVATATAAAAEALNEVALSDIMLQAEQYGFLPDLGSSQDFSI